MQIQKYKYIIPALIIISVGTLAACSGGSPKKENDSPQVLTNVRSTKPDDITLTEAQMKNVGIEIGPIAQKNLDAVIKANGQLAVPPQNRADVSILSGGVISRISVLEGQQVKRGQVLATISNQDLIKIQQDYLAAKSNFTYVQAEFNRQRQLQDAGAGTGKSFQSAQATYNAEFSRIKAFESQLRQLNITPGRINNGNIVSGFPVVSPITGTVGKISANTGAFVQPGTSIMEVVDNSKIHCDLTVFEKDLMQVKLGQKVNFQLTNQGDMMITGKINGINKSFENESKGVIVHAEIDNRQHKNLIPGMYVTALISVGSHPVPAVPVEAVIRSGGRQYIYIVASEEAGPNKTSFAFKKAEVATGVMELGYIEIKPMTSLPANAKAALKGAFYLESKAEGGSDDD
ncbi:membrane fusion protein, cobalt-zinc-cadmium efflux system [Mucilaginibacter lappiensis]|uniref:Cobalt-zinc-cadmium efflux system membrane fusion protein n=1 Tax=Mucilaginibacter lappiensis TaxID=354630 RepID=A0ABR6PP33_9SPHI|nr:efflux RND transporter periplasmic adaptor subunit [Mucilaginibacter lappiensis]MBB6111504.1 cobalt-zinc-cadmium efflux system membrane fusion protein [Mucilaginibacter lappiensis]SIR80391.1 membrane fusion protein, cobalt-zinc-cadmium efflux system [Mucilaginibacter lappiensis]